MSKKLLITKVMTSLLRCYGNTDVNQTYFFDNFIQPLVNV